MNPIPLTLTILALLTLACDAATFNVKDGRLVNSSWTFDGATDAGSDGQDVVEGGTTLTAVQTQGQTTDNSLNATDSSRAYVSQQFTASWGSGTKSIAAIDLRLVKVGSPTGTIRVSIYADSADDPTTIVGGWSQTIDVSTLATSETGVQFTISEANRPTLTHGTTYHVVSDMSSCTTSAGSYVRHRYVGASGSADVSWSADALTWSLTDGSSTATIILYAYE